MEIKVITALEVLPLRSLVLRNGADVATCVFDHDEEEDTWHLAIVNDDVPICILTVYPSANSDFNGISYRLRGMATHPDFRNQGLAKQLLLHLVSTLEKKQVRYLWFDAREAAFPFYEKLGAVYLSDYFDIPGIGPHRKMYLNTYKKQE